jgi:hypothetical protein
VASLCKWQHETYTSYYEKKLIPLCWYGFGDIGSLRQLPITVIERLSSIMQDEEMSNKYMDYRGIPHS